MPLQIAIILTVFQVVCTSAAQPPNVLFIVGDDVGYSDFGYFNDEKTITPTIDGLLEDGIFLSDYCMFATKERHRQAQRCTDR